MEMEIFRPNLDWAFLLPVTLRSVLVYKTMDKCTSYVSLATPLVDVTKQEKVLLVCVKGRKN